MATFHGRGDALKRQRHWHPDVVPTGLDALSYHRGDGVGSWSTTSDEAGAPAEDIFGLKNGTLAATEPLIYKTAPTGEFSVTTYVKIDANNVASQSGGFIFGSNLTGTRANADYFRYALVLDGNRAALYLQEFASDAFVANRMFDLDFAWVGGAYLRAGLTDETNGTITCHASLDGMAWFRLGAYAIPSFTINQIGLWFAGSGETRFPWFRVRTGSGEAANESPEGDYI